MKSFLVKYLTKKFILFAKFYYDIKMYRVICSNKYKPCDVKIQAS